MGNSRDDPTVILSSSADQLNLRVLVVSDNAELPEDWPTDFPPEIFPTGGAFGIAHNICRASKFRCSTAGWAVGKVFRYCVDVTVDVTELTPCDDPSRRRENSSKRNPSTSDRRPFERRRWVLTIQTWLRRSTIGQRCMKNR